MRSGRPAVVEKEEALTEAPQGGGPELVRLGQALEDVVGESWPHMMQQQVGEQADVLVAQGCHSGMGARLQTRRVAQIAADV